MTATFIAPRVPLVDPRTGLCNPIWYRFFTEAFNVSADTSVGETDSFSIAPPVTIADPSTFYSAADMLPLIGALRDEIAWLRGQLDDVRRGLVVL